MRRMGEIMPELGSRKALLLASAFAAVVVVLSTIGPGFGDERVRWDLETP